MNNSNDLIKEEDIRKVLSEDLVKHVIEGFWEQHKISIGIMLDLEEKDFNKSRGTGRFWIQGSKRKLEPYCLSLRNSSNKSVKTRCGQCDLKHFKREKDRVENQQNYEGEVYRCSAGGLLDFTLPIVERNTGTFIGIIIGGQKRPPKGPLASIKYLHKFINQTDNEDLKQAASLKLYYDYLKTEKMSREELNKVKEECKVIAKELTKPLSLLAKNKKNNIRQRRFHEVYKEIDRSLENADNINQVLVGNDGLLKELRNWLNFDWGLLLEEEHSEGQKYFSINDCIGRGLGPKGNLLGQTISFPQDETLNLDEIKFNPDFLSSYIEDIIDGKPEVWLVPLSSTDLNLFGATIFGSAPKHKNTKYNRERIKSEKKRIRQIKRKIEIKYNELYALEEAKRRAKKSKERKEELKENIELLEDTILGTTHQVKRPIVMLQAALSNARDLYGQVEEDVLKEEINLGMLAANHAKIINQGIAKTFSWEMGSEFRGNREEIEVKKELKDLCDALRSLSGRPDIGFDFFEDSPKLEMGKDSFLYVFYNLIDNAIKYSEPGSTIRIGYDREYSLRDYAIKVKSRGKPIKDKSKVFQKFEREQDASRYDESGIGLGCWSAREHMRQSGGDIILETQGRLSVFIVKPPPNQAS